MHAKLSSENFLCSLPTHELINSITKFWFQPDPLKNGSQSECRGSVDTSIVELRFLCHDEPRKASSVVRLPRNFHPARHALTTGSAFFSLPADYNTIINSIIMVYNVERVEVRFARCHDHFVRSRDSRAINRQPANAAKREARQKRSASHGRELLHMRSSVLN